MDLLTPKDLFQKKHEEKMLTHLEKKVSELISNINNKLEIAFDGNALKKFAIKEITAKIDIDSPVREIQPFRKSIALTLQSICAESGWVVIPYVEIFINPGPNGHTSATITLKGNFTPTEDTFDK